jgi:hypothetical protein
VRDRSKPPAIDVPGDRQQIPTPLATENVVFSAYHPLAIIQGARKPLLVSIALDDEKILAKMAAQAQEELARYDKGPFSGAVAPEIVALQRGSLIVIKPDIAGFRFNPPFLPVYWEKDYQSHLFEMWAETAQPGAHNGSIWIMINGLIKARIPLPISVLGSDARSRILNDHALSRGISLKKVFPSYSRKDQEIVDIFRTVEELGRDHYLQDLAYLRAGDDWETRIQGFIKDADLFQLFWSENAARSAEVENEWRFALAEHPGGFGFITPIYWSPIVYQPIPQELRPLDFQHFELGIFTRGKE